MVRRGGPRHDRYDDHRHCKNDRELLCDFCLPGDRSMSRRLERRIVRDVCATSHFGGCPKMQRGQRHPSSGKNRGRSTKSQSASASSRAKSTPSMIGTMKSVVFIADAMRCAPAQHNSKKPKSLGRASACKSGPTKVTPPKRRPRRESVQERARGFVGEAPP